MKHKYLYVLVCTTTLLLTTVNLVCATGVVVNDKKVYFYVDNEKYQCNNTMTFHHILINNHYVQFNKTQFHINSPDEKIYLFLYFLNSSMTGSPWDLMLNFTSICKGGNVWFNISGMDSGSNYTVNRSQSYYNTSQANASGFISWNNSNWAAPGAWNWEVFYTVPSGFIYFFIIIGKNIAPILLSFFILFLFSYIIYYYYFIKRRKKKNLNKE